MDLDIFKRKTEAIGYSFPRVEHGFVIYKPLAVTQNHNLIELTIQSNILFDRNIRHGNLFLTITRFSEIEKPEITVAVIQCKSLDEMSSACNQLDLLKTESSKSAFSEMIDSQNLIYHCKKSSWVKK